MSMYKACFALKEKRNRKSLLSVMKRLPSFRVILDLPIHDKEPDLWLRSERIDVLFVDERPSDRQAEIFSAMRIVNPFLEIVVLTKENAKAVDETQNRYAPWHYVSLAELEKTLKRLRRDIDQKIKISKEKKTANEYDSLLRQSQLRQNFLRLLVSKDVPTKFVEDMHVNGFPMKRKYFQIALLEHEESDLFPFDLIWRMAHVIEEKCKERFRDKTHFLFEHEGRFGILFANKNPVERNSFEERVQEILIKLCDEFQIHFSCGISEAKRFPSLDFSFSSLYSHAKSALRKRITDPKRSIAFYQDTKGRTHRFSKLSENDYSPLTLLVVSGEKGKARNELAKILQKIYRPCFPLCYDFALFQLLIHLLESCLSLDDFFLRYGSKDSLFETLYAKKGEESVMRFFDDILTSIIEINKTIRLSTIEKIYRQLVSYAQERYSDHSLSVSSLSKELGYSSSYLFSALKKHNTTFSKLLTLFRMEEAKRLLSDPNSRVMQIAQKVGFDDPYYFSYCFKRNYGISPLAYRKSIL